MSDEIQLPPNANVAGTMMRHRKVYCTVEYDNEEGQAPRRVHREFTSAPAGRKFYMEMAMAGRSPKVIEARTA